MKKIFTSILLVTLVLVLILGACASGENQNMEPSNPENQQAPPEDDLFPTPDSDLDEQAPAEDSGNGGVQSPPESVDPGSILPRGDAGELPEDVAGKVKQVLASGLGISLEEVEIVFSEGVIWSDGCLGLGGPAESCLAVMVNGWRIELSAEGKSYIARTDETGAAIRFEDRTIGQNDGKLTGLLPTAALKAVAALSTELGIQLDSVAILSWEPAEWQDGCLGLPEEGEMCTMAIVPGWRIELKVNDSTYIARTDETGMRVRFE